MSKSLANYETVSNSWWTTILYTHYQAETRTTADGWDAADVVGGLYAQAKDACQTLVVPPPGDPSRFIIAFVKAAACEYANSAPEVPWTSMRIKTIVCTCLVKGADGSCDPYETTTGTRRLSDECSSEERTWTAGPVTATHHHFIFGGVTCLGATSRHEVDFKEGVRLVEDLC